MKIMTYLDDDDEIHAITEAEFLEIGGEAIETEEYVWHEAPDKEAAINRHSEAHDSWQINQHDFFQHA